jgi:hypothetical protein
MAYPSKLSEKITWHATFNQNCIDNAATFPDVLTVGNLAKILANKNFVVTLANYADDAKNFSQEAVAFRDNYFGATLGTPAPAVPVAPAGIGAAPANTVVGIDAFTRLIVGQLNAHPNMTDAIRAAMGILPGSKVLGSPSIVFTSALGGSQVALKLRLLGYMAVAVDRRRAGGAWEQIGVSIASNFVDADGPLAAGVSESREYRIQGIVANVRQGAISGSAFVATTP